MNQINFATKFFVHVGNYRTAKEITKYGSYVLKQINKEQMLAYATNPELGAEIRRRYLKI